MAPSFAEGAKHGSLVPPSPSPTYCALPRHRCTLASFTLTKITLLASLGVPELPYLQSIV